MPISIQDIAQHMGDSNLPSQSYVDVIERKASICQEHLIHASAISNIEPQGMKEEDLKEVRELRADMARFGTTWESPRQGKQSFTSVGDLR